MPKYHENECAEEGAIVDVRNRPLRNVRVFRPLAHRFTLRLTAEELSRLTQVAQREGVKVSELARQLITEGVDRREGKAPLEERMESLAQEVQALKERIGSYRVRK